MPLIDWAKALAPQPPPRYEHEEGQRLQRVFFRACPAVLKMGFPAYQARFELWLDRYDGRRKEEG